ncbi:MAG: type I restriction enzyme HsdR N-terminal domain-containing protein [Bacteroidota bacterium]|nr:type I restriction enzyme HsdR N-terminal domain-containing protein [Bacteroidota bacterium]
MDFKDSIKQLSERVEKLKENIQTEEATKNAFIMPFISSLGYDVFNPLEVVPEYTCDIGTKKGEKIDYAILKDDEPIILIECKHWMQDLNLHDNQLLRYFHVSKAKFGILTNGIIFKFYTDLETPNKMDEKPFLEINISDLREVQIEEIKKFHKSYFDINNIISSASELKYTSALKTLIASEFQSPSPELVRLLSKQVYDGVITTKLLDQFTGLVKKSLAYYVNDQINDRLKSALKTTQDTEEQPSIDDISFQEPEKEDKIVTTEEEIEGYMIVKSIIRKNIESSRIYHRDTQSYFSVLIDDNNRKPICRLYFNSSKKYIAFLDEAKKEQKYELSSLDDIYSYEEQLVNATERYK